MKIAALSGPSRINAALILCHFIVWLNKELLADLTRCCVAEDLVLKDGPTQTKISGAENLKFSTDLSK